MAEKIITDEQQKENQAKLRAFRDKIAKEDVTGLTLEQRVSRIERYLFGKP